MFGSLTFASLLTSVALSGPAPLCDGHPIEVTTEVPANFPGVLIGVPTRQPPVTVADLRITATRWGSGFETPFAATLEPLAPGWHLLRYPEGMSPDSLDTIHYLDVCEGPARPASANLNPSTPRSWPTSLGEVRVSARSDLAARDQPCSAYPARGTVVLTSSRELYDYQPVTRFDLTWEGVTRRIDYNASVRMSPPQFSLSFPIVCNTQNPTARGRLTISAHTALAPADPPPLSIDADIECPHVHYQAPVCKEAPLPDSTGCAFGNRGRRPAGWGVLALAAFFSLGRRVTRSASPSSRHHDRGRENRRRS